MKKFLTLLFLLLFSVTAYAENMLYLSPESLSGLLITGDDPGAAFNWGNEPYKYQFKMRKSALPSVTWEDFVSHFSVDTNGHIFGGWNIETEPTDSGFLFGTVNICDGEIHDIIIERAAGILSYTVDGVLDVSHADETTWSVSQHQRKIFEKSGAHISHLKIWRNGSLVYDAELVSDLVDDSTSALTSTVYGTYSGLMSPYWEYATQEVTIAAESDDALYGLNSSVPGFTTDTTAVTGRNKNIVGQVTAMNFTDVRMAIKFPIVIPAGSNIASAIMSGYGSDIGIPMTGIKASVFAEADNTPATWSDLADYTTRRASVVTGSVTWNDATIATDGYNDSPELKTIIQGVVDLGETTGIALFVDPQSGCADPGVYAFRAYSDANDPKLTVHYYTDSTPGSTAKQSIMMMW
jgi:hypothetical protein